MGVRKGTKERQRATFSSFLSPYFVFFSSSSASINMKNNQMWKCWHAIDWFRQQVLAVEATSLAYQLVKIDFGTMQMPLTSTAPDKVTIINPDGSVTYEPNLHYQKPTIIRRTYHKAPKPKYRYMIEQVLSHRTRSSQSLLWYVSPLGRQIVSMLSMVSILVHSKMSHLRFLRSHCFVPVALSRLVCSLLIAPIDSLTDLVRFASE